MVLSKFENRKSCHICVITSLKTQNILVTETMGYHTLHTAHLGTLHAEEKALKKLRILMKHSVITKKDVSKGVHILSYRIARNGQIGMGKPCLRCIQRILRNADIVREVQWSNRCGIIEPSVKIQNIYENIHTFVRSGGDPRNE